MEIENVAVVETTNEPTVPENGEEQPSNAAPDAGLSPEERADAELAALYDKLNATEGEENPEESGENADQPDEEALEPENPAIEAPKSWSAEMKEKWAELPPAAQEYIAQREREAHDQISRMGQELGHYRPVGELVGQYQHVFDRNGVTFEDGFNRLMAAQELLERDPLKGLAAIAQTFGVDLVKAFGGQAQGQRPQNPEVSHLQRKISQLEGMLTSQQRNQYAQQIAEQRQILSATEQQVAAWSEGKEHFETVRQKMAQLINSGLANDLDDAYEQAIMLDKDIRQQVEAKREAERQAKEREAQEKAVQQAKRAAKTNTGKRSARPNPGKNWDDDAYLSSLYDSVVGSA